MLSFSAAWRLKRDTPGPVLYRGPRLGEGDLVITANARIDNRDELIALLDITCRPPGELTDSQLILGA